MLTGKKEIRTITPEATLSEVGTHSEGRSQKDDLEFAISLLKIKLQSTTALSEKIRLYNQIKALQDNISTLKTEGSARL